MTAVIRPATVDDADAIGAVHVLAWQAAYRSLLPEGFLASLDPAALGERWRQQLAQSDPRAVVLVAAAPALVGFIAVGPARESQELAELRAIYLDPAWIGQGIGSALHESGLAALQRAGFARALLWVAAANTSARAFYVRHGWGPAGDPATRNVHGADIAVQCYKRELPLPARG